MNSQAAYPPLVGFAAHSGAGKTTLLIKLLTIFRTRGLRVGMIKHAHHQFDIDQPGKDSYELRKAGAEQMLVASSRRWALMVEKEHETEPVLGQLLQHLDQQSLNLILVEGFKHEDFAKIEVHRAAASQSLLYPHDDTIIAVASDEPLPAKIPVLDLNRPEEVARFIMERFL
jgi:molybdopterin-guanine dinucleotide biosynthesis protein B